MTNEQINAAIAEALGWTRIEGRLQLGRRNSVMGSRSELAGTPPLDKDLPEDDQAFLPIPNYAGSLDAMFQVEEWINEDGNRGYEYDMMLCNVVKAYEGIGQPCNHMRLSLW